MLSPMHDAIPYSRNENTYSRTRGGTREDLGFYVRSAWEANYARYLKWLEAQNLIAQWRYEPRTFEFPVKRGTRIYTPDFEVTSTDNIVEWHEVKGWMDAKSRVRLKRFAKYYPEETLVLIDEPVYRDLARNISPMIEDWE